MRSRLLLAFAVLLLLGTWAPLLGVERFPPPDFTQGHLVPQTSAPGHVPRAGEWLDVAVLAGALALASWLTLKVRSRTAIVVLALASLAWFGFWRRGCVCAIGSIQNVARGLADPDYAIPLAAAAFFVLPLVTAFIAGRSFCAAVCPHGALQDLVLVKPLKVPRWLDEGLRFLPWLYLGAAVLLAATGGIFILCKYDPFVGFFRMSGNRGILLAGTGLLVLSAFVGRPYCRYLCPLGALLGLASRVSKWRPTVTPDSCTQCRLCENSCPYGALNAPSPAEKLSRPAKRRRALTLALLIPGLCLFFGWAGGRAGLVALRFHPVGEQAALVRGETGQAGQTVPHEVAAFRHSGASNAELYARASAMEGRHQLLGRWIGAVLGLLLSLKLAGILFPSRSPDYRTDGGRCVSCARCFSSCPYELARRGVPVELPKAEVPHA